MARPTTNPAYLRRLLIGLLAVALGSYWTVHPASTAAAVEADDEQTFVTLINELRTSQGLGPLSVDASLEHESRLWAEELRADGVLSHAPDLSVGVTADWTKLGENVGVGPSNQVQALFDAFVASPGHYANLVDPVFTQVGVGVVYDEAGRMWTTHRFMAVAGGAPPTTAPPTTAPPTTAPPATAPPATAPPATAPPTTTPPTTAPPTTPVPDRVASVPLDRDLITSVLTELARSGI